MWGAIGGMMNVISMNNMMIMENNRRLFQNSSDDLSRLCENGYEPFDMEAIEARCLDDETNGQNDLHKALIFGLDKDGDAHRLIENGVDLNAQDANGNSPYHLFCKYFNPSKQYKIGLLNLMLSKNVNRTLKNHAGQLPEDLCPQQFRRILDCLISQRGGTVAKDKMPHRCRNNEPYSR